MNGIEEFLSAWRSIGAKFWIENGQLRYRAPKGALTQENLEEIRARKSEIISCIQQRPSIENLPPLIPQTRAPIMPLGSGQHMIWSWARQFEDRCTLFEYSAFRLRGSFDIELFKQCLQTLASRNDVLRTRILVMDGRPVQAIDEKTDCSIEFADMSAQAVSDRETGGLRKAREFLQRPIDLAAGPSLRTCVLKLSDNDHVVVLWLPHIIADAWSMGLLRRQLAILYGSHGQDPHSKLPAVPLQFADYVVWKHKAHETILALHLPYWKAHLAGAPGLELPSKVARSSTDTFEGALLSFVLSKDLVAELHQLCRREKVTLFIAMFAALQAVLSCWSEQSDIVVGMVGAQRGMAELQNVMGFFSNYAPMRTDVSGDPSFIELLHRVQTTALEAHEHYYPHIENLREILQPQEPFCKVQFHFNPFTSSMQSDLEQGNFGSHLALTEVDVGLDQYPTYEDLVLTLIEVQDVVIGRVLYKSKIFDQSSILHFISCYEIYLKEALAVPEQELSHSKLSHAFTRSIMSDGAA